MKKDEANNISRTIIRQKLNKKKQNVKAYILVWAIGLVIGVLVGVLLGRVMVSSSRNNESNIIESQEKLEDCFIIKTPIVSLYYPVKWEENVRINQLKGDGHIVQFKASIGSHEEIPLFDICFGGENGYTLGYLEKDGERIPVSVVSYENDFTEDWTEEEQNEIRGMSYDINYIIDMLIEKENFERSL